VLQEGVIYIFGHDNKFHQVLQLTQVPTILRELHGRVLGRHFFSNITMKKILDVGYWWLMMNWNAHEYCQTYDQCQRTGNPLTQNLAKLVTTLPKDSFKKWGLDFIGHVKSTSKMLGNWYIFVATDYVTKWVEAWTLCTHIVVIPTKFLYEHILMRFGCPLTIMVDQGTYFINDTLLTI